MNPLKTFKLAVGGVAALILLIIIFGSFEVISPSERAVKVTMGTASDQTYGPGVQMKIPLFSHFETVSADPFKQQVVITEKSDGAISKDNQSIGVSATVTWAYDTSRVMELVKVYTNRSKLEGIVNDTIYSAIKAEIGKYTIFELAGSAGKIALDARTTASEQAKLYPVKITQISLTNWDWSDDFDAQIKSTMNTQQRVAQAKAEADRIEQESRAQSIKAEAGARALIAQAEGEKQAAILRADARRAEGQGETDYNKLINQSMETEVKLRQLKIELTRAERWNGVQVSTYLPMLPNGVMVDLPQERK
jgi:regulator of protease activity HflC (stomatin/prohibitin superfamily)